jgi:hypothetical protein
LCAVHLVEQHKLTAWFDDGEGHSEIARLRGLFGGGYNLFCLR